MKIFKTVTKQTVIQLICDGCGLEARVDEGYEFSEFISIEHSCGYGAVHGDGNQFTIDLCQHCVADRCGDVLTVIDPVDNQITESAEKTFEYSNLFQAITQSKREANGLKQACDIKIDTRDILTTNRISNQEELQVALKRVEQLWVAQCRSVQGNELLKLADLICVYEKKNWDRFFAQGQLSDDDFMSERLNTAEGLPQENIGAASGLNVLSIDNNQESRVILPSYFDIEQISRLAGVDEKTGKKMWDLLFKAIHEHNKAQVEKEFPTRKRPF